MADTGSGWVNLSQWMGLNADAGQKMAQQAQADVSRRTGQTTGWGRIVSGEARRSGAAGGSTDLSKQDSYSEYAAAKAGLQDAAAANQSGQPGNMWDAAASQPYWTAGKSAQGAYDRLAQQMGAQQVGVNQSVARQVAARVARGDAHIAASTARRDAARPGSVYSNSTVGQPVSGREAGNVGAGGTAQGPATYTVDQAKAFMSMTTGTDANSTYWRNRVAQVGADQAMDEYYRQQGRGG